MFKNLQSTILDLNRLKTMQHKFNNKIIANGSSSVRPREPLIDIETAEGFFRYGESGGKG
jgi:hypothetical protein